ncbi:MAG: GTP 3',8-cyclase MoaA [Verrucomicrobiota bacterium]|nr:GTP 3',8-cyclase MoaA [Verrucomicrobiota bacterium]
MTVSTPSVLPPMNDSYGRTIRDLRVSLTDRCNFRCMYCLPETEQAANFYRSKFDPINNPRPKTIPLPPLKTREEILRLEEIERLVRVAVSLGINKVRLTGGEPLLRRGLEDLIARISKLPGLDDLALTTNGFLFEEKGPALAEAGLRRISFSLDSLDRENFRKITGRDGLGSVLRSIQLARQLELTPIKVNAVIIRGINDQEIVPLAQFAMEQEIAMRFIEFMPLDSGRQWLKELVVPGREIFERLSRAFEMEQVVPAHAAETARRWRVKGKAGEIGIIAPVTEPFCGACNRIRLTADGQVRTCLFSVVEHDIKWLLRSGASDERLRERFRSIVSLKEDRHHIGEEEFVQPARSMSCIGG